VSNPGAEIEESGMYSKGDYGTSCAGTEVIFVPN